MHIDNSSMSAVVEMLHDGHTVKICPHGNSMRPFIAGGKDNVLLALPDKEIVKGDFVMARLKSGHYVMHRIVGIDGNKITLCGDANIRFEYCRCEDICAIVKAIYCKGNKKPVKTDGLKWRIYSFIWMKLYPIRRPLLRICSMFYKDRH